MSHKASIWSWDQRGLSPTDKLVLLAMADSAGHDGRSFCSNKTICEMTGLLKEDTVTEAQKRILFAGLLEDTGARAGATGRVKVFQFPPEACQSPVSRVESPANPPPIPRLTGSAIIKELGTSNADGAPAFESEAATPQKQKSRKREFTDLWCAEFRKKHGWAYKFGGAKDSQAADRILSTGVDPKDLMCIAKSAWNNPTWFNCKHAATIAGFDCKYNDIRHELANPPGAKPTYQKQRVDIRQFKSGNF